MVKFLSYYCFLKELFNVSIFIWIFFPLRRLHEFKHKFKSHTILLTPGVMTNCFTKDVYKLIYTNRSVIRNLINACTFDLINWTNAGKLKNYNDATLNNNRLGLIEQSVVKTKAFFVVIFQKTNKQKRLLTRQFVFLRKLSGI